MRNVKTWMCLMGTILMLTGSLAVPFAANDTAAEETVAVDSEISEKLKTELPESVRPQIVTGRRYLGEWSEEYSVQLATANWDTAELMNTAQYPALHEALKTLAATQNEAAQERYQTYLTYAKEDLEGGMSTENFATGTYTSDIKVRRADETVSSFLTIHTAYNRGPHGSTWHEAHTFRSATGEELRVKDIVTDTDRLLAVLHDTLKAAYPELSGLQEEPMYDYWGDVTADNLVWTMEADTVTFYFDAERLGIYAEGPQTIALAFADYPDLFVSDLASTSEVKSCEIAQGESVRMDVDGDGTLDTVALSASWGEYSNISGITVSVNDQTYTQDIYGYTLDGVVLKHAGGTYLITEVSMDNDYREHQIFNLSGGSPSFVDAVSYGTMSWYDEQERVLYQEHVMDPSDFRWQARTDVLGTSSVFGRFFLGEDGRPVCRFDELYYCYNRVLTTRQEVSGEQVTYEENKVTLTGNTVSLSAGTKITLIGTDNTSYVDVRTEDGVYVRIPVDMTAYPFSSNGIDVEDLFAGILYAG